MDDNVAECGLKKRKKNDHCEIDIEGKLSFFFFFFFLVTVGFLPKNAEWLRIMVRFSTKSRNVEYL